MDTDELASHLLIKFQTSEAIFMPSCDISRMWDASANSDKSL